VEELISELINNDERLAALPRNLVTIGKGPEDEAIELRPNDVLLIAGSSASESPRSRPL